MVIKFIIFLLVIISSVPLYSFAIPTNNNFTTAPEVSIPSIDELCMNLHRIVGGRPASIEEAPYQVSIRYMNRFTSSAWKANIICGGSLISAKIVLSAGHCFGRRVNPAQLVIIMGSTFRAWSSPNSQLRRVRRVVVHPEFQPVPIMKNDIALVILAREVEESRSVRMIPLATDSVAEYASCLITGWGRQDFFNATKPTCLMKAVVPVLNLDECRRRSTIPIGDGFLCAGFFEGRIDSCTGDSGGPLVCDGIQYGIVSYGLGCANKDHPGLYTNVSMHLDWILQESLKNECSSSLFCVGYILLPLLLGYITQN